MNYRHIFLSLLTFFLLSCFDKKLILVNNQYKHDSYHEANSIIFIGDTQKTNKLQLLSEKNTGIQDSLFKKISNDNPDLIIHLGDLVEFGSSYSDWNEFDNFSDYVDKENIPFFSVLGNHEYHGNDKKALAHFFSRFKYFEDKQSWFSFITNGLGVILINSNEDNMSSDEINLQLDWFHNQMNEFNSSNDVSHIIIVSHHPPYTNMHVQYFKNAFPFIHSKDWSSNYIRKNYAEVFLASEKAILFISGHTHSFEHFIIDNKHFIVSGGGGGPRDPINLEGAYNDVFIGPVIRNFHYCRLIRNDNSWIFEMVEYSKDQKWEISNQFVID